MYSYAIEKIKEIPIEDVCKSYGLNLKRKGANLWGRIRNEKTDSFSINPTKNIWRDWGTSEGGSVIDLVMKLENVNEGRAINILGDRFNIPKENNYTSSNKYNLPTKSQFKEIGIVYERTISNFKLDLDKQSIEKLEELEKKYSMDMGLLSKENPKLYHKILDTKALPLIYSDRNSLIDTLTKYKNQDNPLDRGIYKDMIKDYEKSLNHKIDIYNKARLDNNLKTNLKINISDKLPDENISFNANIRSETIKELNIKNQEYIEREIGDFMEEINNSKIIDFNINKDVDVDEILENLKTGVGNIFNNEKFIQYLNFQSQFYNYSANNNLLISLQNPNATNVASFTKWKSLGRTVNKGEKGIVILAPNYTKNSITDILGRLDKYNKTFVNKYTFTKKNDKYSIFSNKKLIKNDLSKEDLTSFIKLNNLSQTQLLGFKKTYVFDVSQTSGEPIPEFKLNKLTDNALIDDKGFYKNPLIKVRLSEGSIYETDKYMTFKQANEIYEKNEFNIRELKKEYEANGDYYPYMKQRMGITYNSNNPINSSEREVRIDLGNGEYDNLLEALKGETSLVKGDYYNTLKDTLSSNDNSMEIVLALKNQLENSITEKGIKLEYTSDTHGANGYFSPTENKICVNDKMSLSATTKTLTHEYVHSQLHNIAVNSKDNLLGRQVAEIEAEATTYVVSKHFGFDTSEYSFDYVSTWAKGKEIKELEQTLKTIKEASEKIINEIKAPFELEVYNTKSVIEEMLKKENINPNEKIIDNIIDINKETGKLNNISDLKNAEKYKSYSNPELNNKISTTNKSIVENIIKIDIVKTVKFELER